MYSTPEAALSAYRTAYIQSMAVERRTKLPAVRKISGSRRVVTTSKKFSQPTEGRSCCQHNSYHQALIALMVMKNDDCAYVDVARDDFAISLLMKLTHGATEKLIAAYLRGDHYYPTEKTLSDILEYLENTGEFGPGQ